MNFTPSVTTSIHVRFNISRRRAYWRRFDDVTLSLWSHAVDVVTPWRHAAQLAPWMKKHKDALRCADDIFKRIFFNENVWISITIPLKFIPKGPINNIPAMVQIMAWRRPGDKPLSDKCWLVHWRIYASLGLNEFTAFISETVCSNFSLTLGLHDIYGGSDTERIGHWLTSSVDSLWTYFVN